MARRDNLALVVEPKPRHPLFKDLTGQSFGRLKCLSYAGRIGGKDHAFYFLCDCDTRFVTRGYLVSTGVTQSCGCLQAERTRQSRLTHGLGGSPIWRIWSGMKTRCANRRTKAYPNYGGVGVKVCRRWVAGDGKRGGFECFLADMGPRPSPAHSIDRYPNPHGDYEPTNCRWATDSQQARNTRKTKRIRWGKKRMTAHEWAAETDIPAAQILKRLGRGWTPRRALTQPLRSRP